MSLKSKTEGQRDDLMGKGNSYQAWWPELNPQDPHGGENQLLYIPTSWCMSTTNMHKHTNKCNKKCLRLEFQLYIEQ